jgi:hypothetical protein
MAPPKQTHQQKQAEAIRELQKNQTRQDHRTRAMLHLAEFRESVLARAESWHRAARNVGSAYAIAAGWHKKALKDQKASDELTDQIMFSILAVVSVGGISWLSSFAQFKMSAQPVQLTARRVTSRGVAVPPAPPYRPTLPGVAVPPVPAAKHLSKKTPVSMVIEAWEDAIQAGSVEGLSQIVPRIYTPEFDAVNQDPQLYQNNLENKVSKVKEMVLLAFSAIQREWSNAPLDAWDKYVEVEQLQKHAEWRKAADELAGDEALQSVEWMAQELERGIWKKYILQHHSYLDFGLFETDTSYDFVGYHVVQRLAILNVTQPLGLPTNIPEGLMDPAIIGPNQAYIDKLVGWAKNYNEKPLVKPRPRT